MLHCRLAIKITTLALFTGFSSTTYAKTLSLDCDTAANAYSELRFGSMGPSGGIKATVVPVRTRPGDDWATSMGVSISSDAGQRLVSVRLARYRKKKDGPLSDDFRIKAAVSENGKEKLSQWLGDPINLGDQVEFKITADEAGLVSLNFGKAHSSFKTSLGSNRDYVIGCSTGQFKFADIETLSSPVE